MVVQIFTADITGAADKVNIVTNVEILLSWDVKMAFGIGLDAALGVVVNGNGSTGNRCMRMCVHNSAIHLRESSRGVRNWDATTAKHCCRRQNSEMALHSGHINDPSSATAAMG